MWRHMQRVTGIGGVFFLSQNPVALGQWYQDHLGIDLVPADYGQKVRYYYTAHTYHQPSDVVKPDWDLSGAREDLMVFLAVGYRVAQADKFPEWKPGNEFKARRDAMLKK